MNVQICCNYDIDMFEAFSHRHRHRLLNDTITNLNNSVQTMFANLCKNIKAQANKLSGIPQIQWILSIHHHNNTTDIEWRSLLKKHPCLSNWALPK